MRSFKIIAIIITLSAIVCLCSCTDRPGPPDATAGTTTSTLEENTGEPSADISLYKIIRPMDDKSMADTVSYLYDSIKELTGKTPDAKDDWVNDESKVDLGGHEILLGLTNRTASLTAKGDIKKNDYTVRVDGDKLVVFAHTAEGVRAAAEHLVSHLTESNGVFTFQGDYTHREDYRLDAMSFLGSDVSDYAIVIPDRASSLQKNFAERLQSFIADNCGVVADLVVSSELGSKKALEITAEPAAERKCTVAKTDRGLSFAVKDTEGFAAMLEQLYLKLPLSGTLAIDETILGSYESSKKDLSERYCNADIRVMTSNVLFDDSGDTNFRMSCLAQTYLSYKPDILCLQEARKNQLEALTPLISGEYTAVKFSAADGKQIYQQIFYRADRFKLLDSGFTRFRYNVVPWGVSYAVFERISDGAKFAVTNAHLTIIADSYDPGKNNNVEGVEYRQNNCRTILSIIEKMRKKYQDIPIISAADWNSVAGGVSLAPLNASELMKNSMYLAKLYSNTTVNSGHTINNAPADDGNKLIDHLYVSADQLTVWYENVIADETVIKGSDHCPVFADISFGLK